MKSILRTILRFPFRLISIPISISILIVLIFKNHKILKNDNSEYKALTLVLDLMKSYLDIIDISIDFLLICMTAGLYCFLLENEIED